MKQQKLQRPRPLKSGSVLGVFTPSSPSHVRLREKYLHGIEVLRKMGFKVVEGSLTQSQKTQGYRAGTPQERADEFMELIRNPHVDGLISTIGGANSSSLIPFLDFDEIRASRKILCGYSDVTSLHLAILAYSGLSTFYGPAVIPSFGEWPDILEETKESFLQAVQKHRTGSRPLQAPKRWSDHLRFAPGQWKTEPRQFHINRGWRALHAGSAKGPLLIANLNTLVTAAGTDYFPDFRGKILLIEEMNATLAEEERDLRHLERLGVFDVIRGLIVSKPEIYDQQEAPFTYEELVLEIVGSERKYPIVTEFDCGHTNPILTLAELTDVSLQADNEYGVDFQILGPMVDE